ncbi:MAG: hypothetical protein ABJE47_20310 [bacterium]
MATDNWKFVTAAFALSWLVMIGYLIHLHRARQRAGAAVERATVRTGR